MNDRGLYRSSRGLLGYNSDSICFETNNHFALDRTIEVHHCVTRI